MTKKHFKAIADLFARERPSDNWDANKRLQHNRLLDGFMAIAAQDNPRFDRERFLKACGGHAYEA